MILRRVMRSSLFPTDYFERSLGNVLSKGGAARGERGPAAQVLDAEGANTMSL